MCVLYVLICIDIVCIRIYIRIDIYIIRIYIFGIDHMLFDIFCIDMSALICIIYILIHIYIYIYIGLCYKH